MNWALSALCTRFTKPEALVQGNRLSRLAGGKEASAKLALCNFHQLPPHFVEGRKSLLWRLPTRNQVATGLPLNCVERGPTNRVVTNALEFDLSERESDLRLVMQ